MCDHFFQAAFGGSFLNHHWLIAAATPIFNSSNIPSRLHTVLGPDGVPTVDGALTPAARRPAYAINTVQPMFPPHYPGTPQEELMPPLTGRTIGDALSEANVSWAWYAGVWTSLPDGPADDTPFTLSRA